MAKVRMYAPKPARTIYKKNQRWSRQRPNNRGWAGTKEHVNSGTAPAITLAPTTRAANSGNYTLTVTAASGTFDSNSKISFNGTLLATSFTSSAQVTATVPNTGGQTAGAKTVFVNAINGATGNATMTYT